MYVDFSAAESSEPDRAINDVLRSEFASDAESRAVTQDGQSWRRSDGLVMCSALAIGLSSSGWLGL